MTKSTEIKRKDDRSFKIKVVLPAKTVAQEYEKLLKAYQKQTLIKGFRKGQAPLNLVEEKVGSEKIYQDLIQNLVSDAYSQAIKENDLRPIVPPKISLTSVQKEKDWQFEIDSSEAPAIDLGNLEEEVKKINAQNKIWTPEKDQKQTSEEKAKNKDQQTQKLIEVIIKTAKIKLAPILIEYEINRKLTDLVDQVQKVGLKIDQYLTSKGIALEQLKLQYRQEIEINWKLELALEEIADKKKITVSDQELKSLEKSEISPYLASKLLRRQKTVDYLLTL